MRNIYSAAIGVMVCIVVVAGCGGGSSSPGPVVSPSPSASVSPSPSASVSPSPSPSPTPAPAAATESFIVAIGVNPDSGMTIFYTRPNVYPIRPTDVIGTFGDGNRVYTRGVVITGRNFPPHAEARYKIRVEGAEAFSFRTDPGGPIADMTRPIAANGSDTTEIHGTLIFPAAMTQGAEFAKPRRILLLDTITGSEVEVPAAPGTAGLTFTLKDGL